VAGSVLAISACGSSSSGNGEAKKKGPEVTSDAIAALKAAGSVHVAGTGTDSDGDTTLDLDISDKGAVGDISQGGGKFSLVNVDGSSYTKANAAFYTSQGASAADAATVADKWVKLPASQTLTQFTLQKFADSLSAPDDNAKIEDKVATGELDGQKVVILSASDGSKLYVAAEGKAYPLKFTAPTGKKGEFNLTDFGKSVELTAPEGALELPSS
jgi:hypothetical protein